MKAKRVRVKQAGKGRSEVKVERRAAGGTRCKEGEAVVLEEERSLYTRRGQETRPTVHNFQPPPFPYLPPHLHPPIHSLSPASLPSSAHPSIPFHPRFQAPHCDIPTFTTAQDGRDRRRRRRRIKKRRGRRRSGGKMCGVWLYIFCPPPQPRPTGGW